MSALEAAIPRVRGKPEETALCANISETTLPWKLEYNRGRRRTKCLETKRSRLRYLILKS